MAMTTVPTTTDAPPVVITARFDVGHPTAEHLAELLLLVPADARLAFPQRLLYRSTAEGDRYEPCAIEATWSVPFGQPLTPPNVLEAEVAEFEPAEVWVLRGELARDAGHHDLLPLPLAFDSKKAAEAYVESHRPGLWGSHTIELIQYATGGLLPAIEGEVPPRPVNCPCSVAPVINVASVHGSVENAERMREALGLQAREGRA